MASNLNKLNATERLIYVLSFAAALGATGTTRRIKPAAAAHIAREFAEAAVAEHRMARAPARRRS